MVQRQRRPIDPRPVARTDQHPLPPSLHLRRRRTPDPGPEHPGRQRLHDTDLRLRRRHQPHKPHHPRTQHRKMRHRRRQSPNTQLRHRRPPDRPRHRLQHLRRHHHPTRQRRRRAGEHDLTSTYYTDNQLASQTQNGQTIGYNLDPAGRTRETVSTGKPNNSDHHLPLRRPRQRPRMDHQPLQRMATQHPRHHW